MPNHPAPTILELKPGNHLCCLYGSEEEYLGVLVPFVRQGLEQGEKVLYIVDIQAPEIITGCLQGYGMDVDPYLTSGQLTFRTNGDTHMREVVSDPEGLIALLRKETEQALSEGYQALRVSIEMTWALRGLSSTRKLIEFEFKLNEFFTDSKCLITCQYDRRRFDPAVLVEVLNYHPLTINNSDVYDNFYYISPIEPKGIDFPIIKLRDRLESLREYKRTQAELRRRTHELDERVKELNCLYGISKLMVTPGISLEGILRGVVDLIPPAWQYPEITCARIVLNDQEIRTDNWERTPWKQASHITVNDRQAGFLEVCYLEARPPSNEGPFRREERTLLNVICEHLGRTIERIETIETLREAHRELEQRVIERTEELARVNKEMRKEISERRRAERRLHHYTTELERSNRELRQFAHAVSHDLQEPARTVSSYMRLLADRYQQQLDADADSYINHAVEGVTRMRELIRDLLAYSEVGTQAQDFKPTNCEEVLENTLANLQVTIKEAQARVTHDPLPTVMADGTQMGQLFQNLIGNAIKFRREEAPCIHISAGEEEDHWLFSARDNGVGMDPTQSECIFEIFQRLTPRNEYPGTGIGLTICKKIVERHGGTIWVDTAPGEGSTFYFTIPTVIDTSENDSED